MNPTFHLLTGEYPPDCGGVGHYTARLAAALHERGCRVHVWCPALTQTASDGIDGNGVRRHALPDVFGPRSRALLERELAAQPGVVLLQYVPNALGARGANVGFCLWLLRMRRRGADVRVMFHEPYFYFTPRHPLRVGLALMQRAMAAILLRAGRRIYLSTERWIGALTAYAPAGVRWTCLPIPSTLPTDAAPDAAWRGRCGAAAPLVGHFGTFGDHVAGELEPLMIAVLETDPRPHFLLVGRRSGVFAEALRSRHPRLAGRIHASGPLADAQAAAALSACDLLVQPYPDGVTTRRTSVMAGLALGVPTVTTDGALTERVWRETGAVRLAPASDPRAQRDAVLAVIDDAEARSLLGLSGRRAYETHFAIRHTVDKVLAA